MQGHEPSSSGGYIARKVEAVAARSTGGLGTLDGVFLPTVQNITGVILFLRLPFITGSAGILLSIAIIASSIATTIPTALAISAIAVSL